MMTHELPVARASAAPQGQVADDPVIIARGLTRCYRRQTVVNQIHLRVPRGSVFALLGRNGAGKTTTIRMLLGLEQPTRGSSTIFGCDSRNLTADVRGRIGYMTESHYVFPRQNIESCRKFRAGTFPVWNDDLFHNVVKHFRLDKNQRVRSLSRGQRAGLSLALTLATEPELLILDDPSLGLDPVAQRDLLEAMLAVATDDQRTILFSSHQLADVERVADHVAILDDGVLRVHAATDEFREQVGQWELTFTHPFSAQTLTGLPGLLRMRELDDVVRITIANSDEAALRKQLEPAGLLSIRKIPLTLDQAVVDYLNPGLPTIPLIRSAALRDPQAPSARNS